MTDQQQQNYKHHCRICRKGFGCGRALGGHMRAHGINEDAAAGEQGDADDEPPAGVGGGGGGVTACSPCGSGGGNRRMYALRGSSNRVRTCRVCENCGKEFSSWKGFLEHGRCNSGCDVSLVSAVAAAAGDEEEEEDDDEEEEEEEEGERRECVGWSKGKRSRRSKVAAGGGLSSQEEDLANCLVMLSAGKMEPGAAAAVVVVETEESCASASKEDRRSSAERTASFLAVEKPKVVAPPPKGMFECKACKKVFSSHQALGGHRASHKKVKGCFAAKLDDLEEAPPEEEHLVAVDGAAAVVPFVAPPLRKKKLHECSVCHRVFTSGQALGGHKRCHWLTSNAADQSSSMARLHHIQTQQAKPLLHLRPMNGPLDLNLPAPPEAAPPPLGLDVPALFLQGWMENDNVDPAATITTNSINKKTSASHVEDEAESSVKLAKLSDLKDLNMGGVSTSWLQVGLGSSSKESRKP
ncbi:unnamed protein product [Spirodela intermedia]|uniref:C2H2-type domain-containing protein n=1 Tax=Spirodela intermedia TaxID=51605 RepID=A0A7I8LLS4_SPIIN|nr:unnamed protein product [Spirodela intermedia]